MNIFLLKLRFYIKKPVSVLVSSEQNSSIINLISIVGGGWKDIYRFPNKPLAVLKNNFFILNCLRENKPHNLRFFLKYSQTPIIIINKKAVDMLLLNIASERGYIISDIETARELQRENENLNISTVGLSERSDLWVSDLNISEETNFKVNYGGDSVPFWVDKKLNKGEVIEILLVVRAWMILGMNLVQISENIYSRK